MKHLCRVKKFLIIFVAMSVYHPVVRATQCDDAGVILTIKANVDKTEFAISDGQVKSILADTTVVKDDGRVVWCAAAWSDRGNQLADKDKVLKKLVKKWGTAFSVQDNVMRPVAVVLGKSDANAPDLLNLARKSATDADFNRLYHAKIVGSGDIVGNGVAAGKAGTPRVKQVVPEMDFGKNAQEIAAVCRAAGTELTKKMDAIAAVKAPNFANTFVALDNASYEYDLTLAPLLVLKDVSTEESVRKASAQCNVDASKLGLDIFMRADVYASLKTVADRKESLGLSAEDSRLTEKYLKDFEDNGMSIPAGRKEQFAAKQKRIMEIAEDFEQELGNDKTALYFTEQQMAGLPESYFKGREKVADKYKVTLDYPDYLPFMKNVKDPTARKALFVAFNNRGGQKNKERLAEILKLREEAAKLKGCGTHAACVLSGKMAKTPEAVAKFLKQIQSGVKEKAAGEKKELIALKDTMEGAASDGVLNPWDLQYYQSQRLKQTYSVDNEVVKQYFPTDRVVSQAFSIFQKVLGLRFEEDKAASQKSWNAEVKAYAVLDAETGENLGRFYLDLYPRDGKYKHMGVSGMISRKELPDSTVQLPVAAMFANFDKPASGKPSLMYLSDAQTFFHEFGHLMYDLLRNSKYEALSGSHIAPDFIEVPSQLFENFITDKTMMREVSAYYLNPNQKMPEQLAKKIEASKYADKGLFNLRQVFLAQYDQAVYTNGTDDSTTLYKKMYKDITGLEMPEGVIPEASFAHIVKGYAAGYYGYNWALSIAQDIYSRFKGNPMNSAMGRDLRKKVFEPGASRDEMASVRDFLGREPNDKAFREFIGLTPRPVIKTKAPPPL